MRTVSPTFPRLVEGVMEVISTSTAFTGGKIICEKIVRVSMVINAIMAVFFFKPILSIASKFTVM
jgi:hypothetical protein